VPAHWKIERLKNSVRSCQNGLWGEEPDGVDDVICVRVADFDRVRLRVALLNPTHRKLDRQTFLSRRLGRGQLLLEKSGGGELQPVGAVVLFDLDEPAVCSNFIARVVLKDGFDARFMTFVHAACYSSGINKRSIKQSTGIQNLDSDSYLNELAPFPPLPTQRAIADFLDRKTSEIDALVARKERLIELLKEKRTALITRAVTKGLDASTPMKESGIPWLASIPAHWRMKPLMRLTPDTRQIMYGIVLPGPDVADGVPIVKGGDVGPGRLRLELLCRTTREIEVGYARSRLRGGDLVYAIRGSIGEVEIVPDELEGANLTQDAARVAPRPGVWGPWLLAALRSRVTFAQLESRATGATISGINIRDLKRVLLPVPPLEEQKRIAETLDAQFRHLSEVGAKVSDAIDRLREYRTALISAAVTGKIGVRPGAAHWSS
jgi:type I restriction enzyme S subunit